LSSGFGATGYALSGFKSPVIFQKKFVMPVARNE
jgi:hypothetical protein